MATEIFMVDSKPFKPSNMWQIWLAWVHWPSCGKPSNDGKCWIFMGCVKMSQGILAVSGSKVTESRPALTFFNLLFQTLSEDSSFLLLLAHQRIRGFAFMRYINPWLILIDTDWLILKGTYCRLTLAFLFFVWCDISFRRYGNSVLSAEVAKNVLAKCVNVGWVGIFGGLNFPKICTVDSKPLKPSNIRHNLVGLGSVAFMWEAWQ